MKNIFALLDGVESDLDDDTDELMNDSDTKFVFEIVDVSVSILIHGANIHVTEDPGESPEGSEIKKTGLMSLKQSKNLKDSLKKKRKEEGSSSLKLAEKGFTTPKETM